MQVADTVLLIEPAGERRLSGPLQIGGTGSRIIVPQAADGEQLRIERNGAQWWAAAVGVTPVLLNAEPLGGTGRELRSGDVLALGDAQILWETDSAAAVRMVVRHQAGNDTVAPLRPPPSRNDQDAEGDVDIVAAEGVGGAGVARSAARDAAEAARTRQAPRRRWLGWGAAAAVLVATVFAVLAQLQRVPLDLLPREARVRVAGSPLSWQSGSTLFALPGLRRVRAELEGYAPLERDVEVRAGLNATQVMRLAKLPGLITIDTGGVAAAVAVDGEPIGRAPGVLKVPAGARTFTLRAERHLDAVARLDVEGRGLPQTLKVALRSSWGKIRVESSTPGAMVAADDLPPAPAPATFDLAAGVHRIKVSAPGAKTWESTAIVAAGQTTKLGPILLGAPDTTLVVRSSPAGADVAVSGVFKGRTPLTIALPPGTSYDLTVSKAGYGAWSRRIDAQPGARLDLQAGLAPVWVNLTVAGEPTDAELFVDGAPQGKLPQTLKLTATRHAVEVRKAGMQNFATQVDLAAGVARTLDYRLVPEGRAADWKPPTERFAGKVAGAFRLVVPTSFTMGSERREQGRRPNETQRKVTFTRPFYIALREVTNGEYRRFRAGHRSGFLGKQSLDLDNQPVSSVAFEDAALYCNWLSQQEGLPEAYESRNGRMTLKQPATAGYRLPTEAEWEYAARYTAQGLRRYEWGNSLPWPSGVANLAGAETGAASGEFLADYRDDYPVVAPVGRFAANALGLHDMTGNVAEWVNDRYASFLPASAINDPVGPDTGRATVVRGASWRTASVTGLRLAARDSAEAARDDLGFRLARYAE